jgi:uncharacterized protein YhaN
MTSERRKAANRAYYIAASQFEAATAALKEATVRTKVWSEANHKVEELHEKIITEQDHHQQLQSKRSRLERVRRLAPFITAIKDIEQKLAELGNVIELPNDAANVLAVAERELAIAQERLGLRKGEVEKITDELEKVHVDDAVLGIAADISKIDELRLQYSTYDRDIERQDMAKSALWRDICEACGQLGWQAESEQALAGRLPTLLVQRELKGLTRDFSGLDQGVQAAEKAERAKRSEIETLSAQLAELQVGEVKPALRAALANARAFGDPDVAIQKQKVALTKTQSALETALQELGQWRMDLADLSAMKPPSQQKLSRLLQDRQNLVADRKAALKRLEEQNAKVAGIELEISQFETLHHPITNETVSQARRERDTSWNAIKTSKLSLQQEGQNFEALLIHADTVADQRLDDVEEATKLQSLQHQLEREKHSLALLDSHCSGVVEELQRFDNRWLEEMVVMKLANMSLEDMGAWVIKREKTLVAAGNCRDAQEDFESLSRTISELKLNLANALRESNLQVADGDSLSALRVQAESFIQAIDGAKVRQQTLSDQCQSAQGVATTLKQATDDANTKLNRWAQAWAKALAKAGLPEDSDIGSVEAAMELIGQIEDKLKKIRSIQERIDAMNVDLEQFAAESHRLVQLIAPELKGQPTIQTVQVLAKRLAQARETAAEASRLKDALYSAKTQAATAQESIQTATAAMKPLLERAGVNSNVLLAEAIAQSDEYRRLNVELGETTARLASGGDGLSRIQIEAEVDAVDLAGLAVELMQTETALADAVQRQTALSAEHANACQALSKIGGSDAAAQAEAQRQEALAKMADVAERYVKVFTAGRLLRWSIDRYREEKQGPLLARAGAIFSGLTLGSFQRLIVDFDVNPPVLEGQRADGKLAGISGLSVGTRDQLYLALRLAALEMHLEQAMPLPFIADDLFINYDDVRAKAGFEALAALSERTQVIFLSHHDHLISTVQEVFGKQVNVIVL